MDIDELVGVLADCTRAAVSRQFLEHPEAYYYITLATSEGLSPALAMWSQEALERAIAAGERQDLIKWSYSDSPYQLHDSELFAPVARAFATLPSLDDLDEDAYCTAVDERHDAMVRALEVLDAEGLFGTGSSRADVLVIAEVVPPDASNTGRAVRLNPPGHVLEEWLAEAAEEE